MKDNKNSPGHSGFLFSISIAGTWDLVRVIYQMAPPRGFVFWIQNSSQSRLTCTAMSYGCKLGLRTGVICILRHYPLCVT